MQGIGLTFDYELFFKVSGTPEKCVLEPTGAILDVLAKAKARATFFVDALYYAKISGADGNMGKTARSIKEQLRRMAGEGHEIGFHLHPHWLSTVWQAGAWNFPDKRFYRLKSLDKEKGEKVCVAAKAALEDDIREKVPSFGIRTFRAGGWGIEPFALVKPFFESTGITIDSSVLPGMRLSDPAGDLDFSSAPDDEKYKFNDTPLQKEPDGRFTEVPVTTYKRLFPERSLKIISKLFRRQKTFGDGKGLESAFAPGRSFLSLDQYESAGVAGVLKRLKKDNCVFVSHPKLMTRDSLRVIETLAKEGYEFRTMRELADGRS